MAPEESLKSTPLDSLHRELGGRMVPFAGYAMPVNYPTGIIKEHNATRESAGLFDVSHMGQVRITPTGSSDLPALASALEHLVPADICNLRNRRIRYTQFTNDTGGIIDDLMVTARNDHLVLVVNASRKYGDVELLRTHLDGVGNIEFMETRALLALQGPKAVTVLKEIVPECADLSFMEAVDASIDGAAITVSRCGYTGEDGYEISVSDEVAESLARRILRNELVTPIGLGARDSLRLEAGLCLYGHDIDEKTTPVEADLAWTIQKRRRAEGGFRGADVILDQLKNGAGTRRVGIRPASRAPVREGAAIRDGHGTGQGYITSGGFGATVGGPVAMGYVKSDMSAQGTQLEIELRGKSISAEIVALPFVPHRYIRSPGGDNP